MMWDNPASANSDPVRLLNDKAQRVPATFEGISTSATARPNARARKKRKIAPGIASKLAAPHSSQRL